jgi:hypothetical protein
MRILAVLAKELRCRVPALTHATVHDYLTVGNFG